MIVRLESNKREDFSH